MIIHKEVINTHFDFAIIGLGYESRADHILSYYSHKIDKILALGYEVHQDQYSYEKHKSNMLHMKSEIFEGSEASTQDYVLSYVSRIKKLKPVSVLLDITVMSRYRLGGLLCTLLDNLPENSTITVAYSPSTFVQPPEDSTTIRHLGEISQQLSGGIGDLSQPTAVVFGLGYEKSKALGVLNHLDCGIAYAFIPQSPITEFEEHVKANNKELLNTLNKDNIFYYDICSPYNTFLDLRSLILSIKDRTRPLLIPLGPKIFASLSVILGKELYPQLPVWRVSSGLSETPTDRKANGERIEFSITT